MIQKLNSKTNKGWHFKQRVMLYRWEEKSRKFGLKLCTKSRNHQCKKVTKLAFRALTHCQSEGKYPSCIYFKQFHTRAHIPSMPPCGANAFRTLISTINLGNCRFTRFLHTGMKVTNAKVMHKTKWKSKSTTRFNLSFHRNPCDKKWRSNKVLENSGDEQRFLVKRGSLLNCEINFDNKVIAIFIT